MTTATMTMCEWWRCDWTPGRGRKLGRSAHVLYADAPIIGSATRGPTEQESFWNVNDAAATIRRRLERARIDFVLARYGYYREMHPGFVRTQRIEATARDTGLTRYEVGAILEATYADVA